LAVRRSVQAVERLYAERYHVKVEPGLGFENTFAMVVRGDDEEVEPADDL
jgi:osmoprotectant transport system substrate-binding protein